MDGTDDTVGRGKGEIIVAYKQVEGIVTELSLEIKAIRPTPIQYQAWRDHYHSDIPYYVHTKKKVNQYLGRLFGKRSRAYQYGSFMRSVAWCRSAGLAIEKAYLAGASDALAKVSLLEE